MAQKLDVTARIAGDTWIAAAGPDRSEIRVLLVGKPDAEGAAPFALTRMQFPISRGSWAWTLQGTWTEVGSGDATLRVAHTYTLPDESGTSLYSRVGTHRDDTPYTLRVTVTRNGGQLVVAGDGQAAATYVGLTGALGRLGTATERDAACAFQIANLAIRSSEIRIIGFNGPGMSQYHQAETYVGTVSGTVRVSMSGTTNPTTRIEYGAFVDFGGVQVTGPQVTDSDTGGNGHMSEVMTFALVPLTPDPGSATTITGTLDFGGAGNSAEWVQISNGNATGGVYITTIDGGGSARLSPVTAPSPSVSDCLALP